MIMLHHTAEQSQRKGRCVRPNSTDCAVSRDQLAARVLPSTKVKDVGCRKPWLSIPPNLPPLILWNRWQTEKNRTRTYYSFFAWTSGFSLKWKKDDFFFAFLASLSLCVSSIVSYLHSHFWCSVKLKSIICSDTFGRNRITLKRNRGHNKAKSRLKYNQHTV